MYEIIKKGNKVANSQYSKKFLADYEDFLNLWNVDVTEGLRDYFYKYSEVVNSVSYKKGIVFEKLETGLSLSRDLPGYGKDNLEVSLRNDNLMIIGKRVGEEFNFMYQVDTKQYDIDNIDVKYKDGVLNIFIPNNPQAEPRILEIQD